MAEPTENLDSVMRRIRKLMAIAQDGRGSMAEAQTAAAMAQRIMAKYKLEHQDLLISELRSRDNFGEDTREVKPSFKRDTLKQWAGQLAVAIARANDAHVEWHEGKTLRFWGMKSDVEVSGYMFDYLVDQVQRGTQAFFTLIPDRDRAEDFRQGMITGVCKSLRGEQAPNSGNALVVAKAAAVEAHFGKVMRTVPTRYTGGTDNGMGRQAGANVDVNRRGVGQSDGQFMIGN